MNQIYSSIPTAQMIAELCVQNGIEHVVISPGSRNAPLTITLANHPKIKAYSIVDERCAAFFALGMTQRFNAPVAVVCTSGSALLNYYPAVSEAFYSNLPLVVISADRPPHLIDIGDGQTIRQPHVFTNHILYSANLKGDSHQSEDASILEFNTQEVHKALQTAIWNQGPVHINAPFDEPLYHKTDSLSIDVPTLDSLKPEPSELDASDFIHSWNSSAKKLVLVGVNLDEEIDEEVLKLLSEDPSVIVMTEITSNISHPNFFTNIDSILAPIELEENTAELCEALQPEVLITFGGLIVSKKVKKFLREFQPQKHFHIDPREANDTFFCLSKHFETTVSSFFERVNSSLRKPDSTYFESWNAVRLKTLEYRTSYKSEIGFSDFAFYYSLFENLPQDETVHFANSSSIRYANLFDSRREIKAFANRGTSGIDGSTSTAIGYAVASQEPTTLVTGDLSFFYDSNALWNKYIPKSFKIILLNNAGGGIFRILPGNKEEEYFANYFETTHELHAKHLCDMYQIQYTEARSLKQVDKELPLFFERNGCPQLIEIFTPRLENDKVLLTYFDYLKTHIDFQSVLKPRSAESNPN
ncbi:2-succinyl-5-enolpyruvyl-6-hydroxy-3-cyclohexene-1-carboxylic-acid synthase [Psychroflexus sediminis]|uniref:2-succinyl-5-enolpyruvyl-6-hydroxy-3-cyclohexene-1-carboxylate synthase n=1 Tax=Psychroflexus sediminis TaxID=470826 RepID=A0A1G7V451_9FLAO|nr:2-succinyl-5-enolpyruvyl-6-hydroxy-3-cyclohexene-1-carboxylic-acid synthase [Psychroflexus sediminis]SDG53730.1 2-succinyl-5-enolpyruvyl-6-hydroxy-3-cyclohexene-1-carboxylate synthase [Psychroflexus sediminis]